MKISKQSTLPKHNHSVFFLRSIAEAVSCHSNDTGAETDESISTSEGRHVDEEEGKQNKHEEGEEKKQEDLFSSTQLQVMNS